MLDQTGSHLTQQSSGGALGTSAFQVCYFRVAFIHALSSHTAGTLRGLSKVPFFSSQWAVQCDKQLHKLGQGRKTGKGRKKPGACPAQFCVTCLKRHH